MDATTGVTTTVPEQRTARAAESASTLTDIVARLTNNPTPTAVRSALAHHEMYVRAKVAREKGERLVVAGGSFAVEEAILVDADGGSDLYEVWVKREDVT